MTVEEDPGIHKGVIWFDNIFPYKHPYLDPRAYLIDSYSTSFMDDKKYLDLLPKKFPEGAAFEPIRPQENLKEGHQI